ncbi:helix-turn-helix transcriptional regulator [Chitinophaga sp.]|uniref:helix-turn-helix domain-containing protein n=1 Tax=Chitinophaga sp. TaxID=1869181 RepID=UPI0031D67093
MSKEKQSNIEEYHLNKHQPGQDQFRIYDLNTYLGKNSENTTRPHIHSYYQIIWFYSGVGSHYVDFVKHDVTDQMIFCIARNQVHCFDHHPGYEGVLLHFNETFLAQSDETDFFLKCNLFSSPYQQPGCKIDAATVQKLNTIIQQIKAELEENNEFGRDEIIRAYLKSFLILVQRTKQLSGGQQFASFAADDKRMQLVRFFNLVEQHYKKGLAVNEYARLLHISARTLSDLTSQLINKTPSQMIQERIILEAQRLLTHSSLNINQIGYRMGFDDPSYFVKYFKKHTKMSPSDFRKAIA